MSNWIGQTLGKVHIDTLLARGGMAEVYIGTHTSLQRQVAVKILRNQYDEQPHALERFQREAMVVGKLRHPNIVQVFDFDTTRDSEPYLVMEYIRGPSLQTYLNSLHAKDEVMDFPHIVRLMTAMTSALQYAHDSGVIHRDIKPGNILLTSRSSPVTPGKPLPDDFEPVLTDFGLVRFLDSTQHTTGSGQIAGTPAYMSPEQARGELTDGRTDVYSLGIVLYEVLAGHLPFEGETTMGVLMKHISAPPLPVPGLPPTMQLVLDRALAKELDERFQTPAEFGEAFSAAVENRGDYSTIELGGPSPTKKKPATKIFKRAKPRRWIPAAAIAGVLTLALGALVVFRGLASPSPMAGASTSTETNTVTMPVPSNTVTNTSTLPSMMILGRTGVLEFHHANAIADQAALRADALLAPPEGNQYEVWLVNDTQRLSLGVLTLDASGKGELVFEQTDGSNLIALYDGVEVTVEPDPDTNSESSGLVAYAFSLPQDGLRHIRYVLHSFPTTPNNTSLIQGLYASVTMISEIAHQMEKAVSDDEQVRTAAEAIQNMIVGNQSPNYGDLNNDGEVEDLGDGFGLLLNGRNLGYLPAVFTEAELAATSAGASEPMITYGESVKASVQNLARWSAELEDLTTKILAAPPGTDLKQQVAEVVALADKMLEGIDLNEDGRINAELGEAGAQGAFDQAYHMADMPLNPVGILNMGTGTPTFMIIIPTTASGDDGDTGDPAPTQRPKNTPRPTNENKPPKTDKPNENKNNSNGSSN